MCATSAGLTCTWIGEFHMHPRLRYVLVRIGWAYVTYAGLQSVLFLLSAGWVELRQMAKDEYTLGILDTLVVLLMFLIFLILSNLLPTLALCAWVHGICSGVPQPILLIVGVLGVGWAITGWWVLLSAYMRWKRRRAALPR